MATQVPESQLIARNRCSLFRTGATMRQNYTVSNLDVQWLAIGPA